jgi:chromosome segregation protein
VQTDGKLKPWLAKHGLDALQGLWSRIHIEPGWETALEAALRERLGALEVGRLDMVRAFAADAPPAKLAFYSARAAAGPEHHAPRCRACPTCCASRRCGLKALLGDWLRRLLHRSQPGRSPGQREPAAPGEVI